MNQALEAVQQGIEKQEQLFIVTPNPEILLHARSYAEYREVLNSASLSLPDGFGLRLCSGIQHTVTGSSFTERLLELANSKQLKVLCIVREDGLSSQEQVQTALQRIAPNSIIKITAVRRDQWKQQPEQSSIDFQPHIILVGLGFPEQEYWLHHYKDAFSNNVIGVGIGGTFDFFTGAAKRAPAILRGLGLEWLWRLCTEPKRWKRIINAVVVFPAVVLLNRKTIEK